VKVSAVDIGYTDDELSALPEDVMSSSFGSGNPLGFSDVANGETVFDLGSCAGLDLLVAAKKEGPSDCVIGVDMTAAMIEKVRAIIAAVGLNNVEVRKGVIENLPVDDGSVDWVISNWVINLSTDKDRVFEEIFRVLRPGGRVQVSDIVMEANALPVWISNYPGFLADLRNACVAGAINEGDYMTGLREAGLIDVQVNVPEPSTSGVLSGDRLTELVDALTGKVWSGKCKARRPIGVKFFTN